jgi:hypothetical protein
MYEATLNGSIGITGKVNPLTSETRLTWRNCWEKGGEKWLSEFHE